MVRKLALAIVALATLVVPTVLLLSDRAPGIAREATDGAAAEARRFERASGRDLFSRPPIGFETAGHVVLFFMVTVLLALALGRRVPVIVVGALVFLVSAAFEVLQQLVTTTRLAEPADLAANGAGAGAAVIVVGALRLVLA